MRDVSCYRIRSVPQGFEWAAYEIGTIERIFGNGDRHALKERQGWGKKREGENLATGVTSPPRALDPLISGTVGVRIPQLTVVGKSADQTGSPDVQVLPPRLGADLADTSSWNASIH